MDVGLRIAYERPSPSYIGQYATLARHAHFTGLRSTSSQSQCLNDAETNARFGTVKFRNCSS
jgi:hypothetical protein